ncbi:3',5'-cyclic adenosine monophosphate phosphodiesterase CpdA [Alsobacter metallidurans]|uniref:3',5'-cyclic adenosine monophosphate phosphodiesterase CpdA n=1 Tax=Alsobacter metallidurans TaxID=340221 RepID=A0A917IAV9_9HYPH|nr:metallophosphoesterase [Alsobacter metallidurans]GGH31727.1 3',5'-cyclic adenosine monophosphate phosphodiesterase CpdA [Alsobacter metallidurans]
MLIAHVSDFHVFSERGETHLVRPDAERAARAVVADLASLPWSLDAIVISGDLTDGGSEADYALLRDVLGPLQARLVIAPGNHDRRDTMRAAFADLVDYPPGKYLHYETQVADWRVLALDTLIPGRVPGRLCSTRLKWVSETIAPLRDKPLLIVMHHPPFPSGMATLDRNALIEGGEEFGRLVAARRAPTRILSGHIHRPFQAMWNGAVAAVAGSPAFQIGLDLAADIEEPGPVTEPYSYFLHRLGPDGAGVIHTRYVAI